MRVCRNHTQNYIKSILGFFHINVIDSTMHSILSGLLLLIVAMSLCLALLLLGALVGEVPKVARTKTRANVAQSLTGLILLLGLVVIVGSLLLEVRVQLLLLLLPWLHWRFVSSCNLIWHLLQQHLLLTQSSLAEHRTCRWGVETRTGVAA